MGHLSGLSLNTPLHQLSTGRIHSQLSRDVHGPIYQHCLAGRQKQEQRIITMGLKAHCPVSDSFKEESGY